MYKLDQEQIDTIEMNLMRGEKIQLIPGRDRVKILRVRTAELCGNSVAEAEPYAKCISDKLIRLSKTEIEAIERTLERGDSVDLVPMNGGIKLMWVRRKTIKS